jgi:predicted HTH transcriptional regulator
VENLAMTTEELERLLEGQEETQRHDFKEAIPWRAKSFVKDLLAMANVQDGGYIIVGVEDGTWRRQGITQEMEESYNIEIMRDQMAVYADPHVEFSREIVPDRESLRFAVIRVRQFDEIPVICRKDGEDVREGVLYYRSTNRRIESAPVRNSYDMRTIIEVATIRMMQRKRSLGFTVESSAREQLEAELGGL